MSSNIGTEQFYGSPSVERDPIFELNNAWSFISYVSANIGTEQCRELALVEKALRLELKNAMELHPLREPRYWNDAICVEFHQ